MGASWFKAPSRESQGGSIRRGRRRSSHGGSIKQRVTVGFSNWLNPDTRTWKEKEDIVEQILKRLLISNDELLQVIYL